MLCVSLAKSPAGAALVQQINSEVLHTVPYILLVRHSVRPQGERGRHLLSSTLSTDSLLSKAKSVSKQVPEGQQMSTSVSKLVREGQQMQEAPTEGQLDAAVLVSSKFRTCEVT